MSTACRLEDALGGCGIPFELNSGADRPRDEIASAVGADAAQARLSAIATERALIGADHGFRRVGREIPVAALAVGAQL